MIILIKIILS